MPSVVGTMRLVAGVQNMCQRVSTAARHFFLTRDFYTIYAIFTQFYVIFAQFYMIFTQFYAIFAIFTRFFARHKFSAARHLKLFCTPATSTDLAQMQKFFNGRDAGAGDPVLRQTIETVQVIAWSAFW